MWSFLLPAFQNVGRFLLVSIPFGLIFVVLLAMLLHARPNRFSLTMRTLYFVPGAVVGPPLVMLFLFTFNPDLSVFRSILHLIGYTDIKEVVNNDTAPVIFTLMGFFGGAGGWIAVMGREPALPAPLRAGRRLLPPLPVGRGQRRLAPG